jgi:predicted dehydrogenase
MKNTVHWAILGPGKIAHKFADAFPGVSDATLYAVASRDVARGKEFAGRYNIPKTYTSYEALVADPQVDIVYIATPHPFHHAQALLCLNHKKAVVCEKPLTINYRQTLELVSAARANNTFLMEGMWSRFFPATLKTTELIRAGVIGEVKFLRADFGFIAPLDLQGRVFNVALGGGAQLDVGVYPMFLALLLLGKPDRIQALGKLAVTGADETTSVQFHFSNGSIAHILSSVVADTSKQAEIIGTLGTIIMHSPWHKSQAITIKKNTGETETIALPFSGIGFEFQLEHATACFREGRKESALMTHELSVWMAETADEILRQCGVVYPETNPDNSSLSL